MTYTIKIDHFEGPFDLLLFFIERDELDIYDIPIAKITTDFLAYVRDLESMNIDLASEFILVAATLMRIKAKILLPRKELDEEGREVDPRQELVARLLEYKRYKSVLEQLRTFESDRALSVNRGNAAGELHKIATRALVDVELESLTQFKLFRAFSAVLERFAENERRAVHTVERFKYTVADEQDRLLEVVTGTARVDFKGLFEACEDRLHAIVVFLAMLELLNLQKLQVVQGEGMNNFWISAFGSTDEEE